MSLYGKYIKEHRDDDIIEYEHGFATYRYLNEGKSVYIVDIYVLPDYRQSRLATEMANDIASEAAMKGCKEMLGTVVPSAKNATESLKVLLGYGMKLHSASQDLIVFKKEL